VIFYINNTGAAVNPLVHLHRRWRSGVVFFIDSTKGNSVPLCSSPLMAFQRDLIHR